MRDVRIMAFTSRGVILARRIAHELSLPGRVSTTVHTVHAKDTQVAELPLDAWVAQGWSEADALVFVGAAGIAVRSIAKHVVSKLTDPAVVVVDETGRFAIPLVGGHVGGANHLAAWIAAAIGASAVVTTATDARNVFAIDAWAVQHALVIANPAMVKAVSMSLLEGKSVGFVCDTELQAIKLPEGFVEGPGDGLRVIISHRMHGGPPDDFALLLVPRMLSVGIGCRKGVSATSIADAVNKVFAEHSLDTRAMAVVSSIDVKRQELGLLEYCRQANVDLEFHTAATLQAAAGTFVESPVVKRTVGVGSVCDRSAVASSHGGRLIIPRQICSGITVAVARIPFSLDGSLEEQS